MISGSETYPAGRIPFRIGAKDPIGPGALLVELVQIVLLTGACVAGMYFLTPRPAGGAYPAIGAVLFSTLFPLAMLIILSIVERLFPPAGPRKSLKSWLMHFRINIFLTSLLALGAAWTIAGWTALAGVFGLRVGLFDLRLGTGMGLMTLIGAIWVASIMRDFFFYWFHRILHEVPFFWQHHKMHHMDPELEAITVIRQNWVETIFSAIGITLPVAVLFRFDPNDVTTLSLTSGIITTIFTTMLTAGHLNVRVGAGPLSVLVCTPQMHRVHHSMQPQHFDKNYAFIFPLWDVIFGTYYHPARDEYPPTGVKNETEISSFLESQLFTQREWWKFYKAWRARRGALRQAQLPHGATPGQAE